MNNLLMGIEYVRTDVVDFLTIRNEVKGEKFLFVRSGLDYLGFKISREDIVPVHDKVEAIKNIVAPKTKKQRICLLLNRA